MPYHSLPSGGDAEAADAGRGGAAAAAGQGCADAQRDNYIWWEFSTCGLPDRYPTYKLSKFIRSALHGLGYGGPVRGIFAYGNFAELDENVQNDLNTSGISPYQVHPSARCGSDKKLLVDLLFWAGEDHPPSNCLIITGSTGFSGVIGVLRKKNHKVLFAGQAWPPAESLPGAERVWLWSELQYGRPPLAYEMCKDFISVKEVASGESSTIGGESPSKIEENQTMILCLPTRMPSIIPCHSSPTVSRSFSLSRPTGHLFVSTISEQAKRNALAKLDLESFGNLGKFMLALNILRDEMVLPTRDNINDCIQYGEVKVKNFVLADVLEIAEKLEIVAKHISENGDTCYTEFNEPIWMCVQNRNDKKYTEETWDAILKFLITSSSEQSEFMSSECRYQAALILKKSCLGNEILGDIFQILDAVIDIKKWVITGSTGWQPLSLGNVAEKVEGYLDDMFSFWS